MPRVISFIVLLAIILLVGAVFFQVMAQFMVPLFLACVLLVVFKPLHGRILSHLPTHPRISALITTVLILLVVLLPLVWLGWNAYGELRALVPHEDAGTGTVDLPSPVVARSPSPVAHDAKNANTATAAAGPSATLAAKQDAPRDGLTFRELLHKAAFDLRNRIRDATGFGIDDPAVLELVRNAGSIVASKALSGVQSALGILVGLAIMVIALYYFLADGPVMIATVMDLSPLDAQYEQELLERFGDVSRAVVVATLLSALVQGTLAGIGYSFALPITAPIFLLTAATMVTALVPFVGAAATWIGVCIWIYFYGERVVGGQTVQGDPKTAIILAVYCTIVVSGIDNVIKPFILHGQSKLHPLLALLSILGGIQVLGPVGILVGPMLVSFLQALLNMLRKELDSFGGTVVEAPTPLAGAGGEPISSTAAENGTLSPAKTSETSIAKTPASNSPAPAPQDAKKGRLRRRKK